MGTKELVAQLHSLHMGCVDLVCEYTFETLCLCWKVGDKRQRTKEMLRRTFAKLGVSPWAMFVQFHSKTNDAELAKSGARRLEIIGNRWKKLPEVEKQKWYAKAKRTPWKPFNLKHKMHREKFHGTTEYNDFVSKMWNYSKLEKLTPQQRMRVIAKSWRKLKDKT